MSDITYTLIIMRPPNNVVNSHEHNGYFFTIRLEPVKFDNNEDLIKYINKYVREHDIITISNELKLESNNNN